MDGFIEAILGLLLGLIVMYWFYGLFNKKKKQALVKHQSTVILDRIKSVCKLVSVEGDFAEIYRYENIKDGFLNLLSSKKKALVVINAKAQVGYDLKKLKLEADLDRKRIILTAFPEPEVLSSEDLTDLNAKAKEHIRDKIPESGLLETAKKEALEAVMIIEKIVETIGWRLDYSDLELSNREKQFLETETS